MRKITIILGALFLLVCITGCGGDSGKQSKAAVKPPTAATNAEKKDNTQKGEVCRFECTSCHKIVETAGDWPRSGRCPARNTLTSEKRNHRWKRIK